MRTTRGELGSGMEHAVLKDPKGNRRRRGKNSNAKKSVSNAGEVKSLIVKTIQDKRILKYFDYSILGATSIAPSPVGYSIITSIPQGAAQKQRVSDVVELVGVDLRINLSSFNSDVFVHIRWCLVIWKQNSQSVGPGDTSIYENPFPPATPGFSVYSPFNYEGREYYSIVSEDNIANLIGYNNTLGTVAGVTDSTSVTTVRRYPLRGHQIQFGLGLTSATGHIYFVNYSDSVLLPHPVYNVVFRTWYYDT